MTAESVRTSAGVPKDPVKQTAKQRNPEHGGVQTGLKEFETTEYTSTHLPAGSGARVLTGAITIILRDDRGKGGDASSSSRRDRLFGRI